VDRRAAGVILAAVAVGALALRLSSETLTMTTSYPAPVGVYNQLVTTGNAGTVPASTTLARNAGDVLLVPPTNSDGRVGVGTAAPGAKLEVAGDLRLDGLAQAPAAPRDGTLYFDPGTKTVRLFAGGWSSLGDSEGAFCGFYSNGQNGAPSLSYKCRGTDLSRSGCPAGYAAVALGSGVTCLKL
jgi:hypothetical protein